MKKIIKGFEIFSLVLFITMVTISCNGKNINMTDKERLLKERVQEFCHIMEEGKFRQTRNYYIPQWQNKPEQAYKGDFSSWKETKGIIDYYKIKAIKFRDDNTAEVLIDSSLLNEKYITYDYWIFVKDNWYIVDYNRSDSVSSYEIKEYKELIQNDYTRKGDE